MFSQLFARHRQIILFGIIGALNTSVDIVLYLILTGQGLSVVIANIISTTTALLLSFVLNKKFAFQSQTSAKQTLVPFLVVTLTGLWILQPIVIHIVHAIVGNQLFSGNPTVAELVPKLVATIFSVVWNYVLYKKFVFKTTPPSL